MPIYDLPALKGLSGLNEKDRNSWMQQQINNGVLSSSDSFMAFDRVYKNDLFVKMFGMDAFNYYTNPADRDAMFKHTVTQHVFDKRYKDKLSDDEYNAYNSLTDDGKLELLGSNVLTPSEIENLEAYNRESIKNRREEVQKARDNNWFVNAMMSSDPVATSVQYFAEENMIEYSRKAQEKRINHIFEKDAARRLEDTSPEAKLMLSLWQDRLNNGQMDYSEITTEFGKLVKYLDYYKAFQGEEELKDFGIQELMEILANYYSILNQTGNPGAAINAINGYMQNYIAGKQDNWDKTKLFLGNIITGTVGTVLSELSGYIALAAAGVGSFAHLVGWSKDDATGWVADYLLSEVALYIDGIDKYNTFNSNVMNIARENGGISPNQRIRAAGTDHDIFTLDTAFDMAAMVKFLIPMFLTRGASSIATRGLTNLSWKLTKKMLLRVPNRVIQRALLGAFNASKFMIGAGGAAASTTAISNMYAMSTWEEALKTGETSINNIREKAFEKTINHLAELEIAAEEFGSEEEREARKKEIIEDYLKDEDTVLALRKSIDEDLNIEQLKRKNELSAAEAYMMNATVETIRMGVENSIFRKWMLAKGTKANLGMNSPYLRAKATKDRLALANKGQNKWKPLVNNVFGGFESNYMDDVTARFGKEFGIARFNDYIGKTYSAEQYAGIINNMMDPITAALHGATEAFTDALSFWDGFIGAGGSILQIAPSGGIFKRSTYQRGIKDAEGNKVRNRTWAEAISNFIYNPILAETVEALNRVREAQERIDNINKDLSSELGQKTLKAIREAITNDSNLTFASMSGSMLEAADAKTDLLFGLARRYIELTTDPLSKEHPLVKEMQALHEKITNAKSAEDVADLIHQAENRPDSNVGRRLSSEEQFQAMKDNALKLTAMLEKYLKIWKDIERTPVGEHMPEDLKVQLTYQLVKDENWKERLDSITSELGITKDGTGNSIAQFGTKRTAQQKLKLHQIDLDKVNKQITEAELDIQNALKSRDGKVPLLGNFADRIYQRAILNQVSKVNEARAKVRLESLKEQQQKIQNKIDAAKAAIERIDGYSKGEGTAVTLSSNEILNLSLEDMAYMLDPKHKDEYTIQQQEEIEKALEELAMKDPEYLQKVQDAAELQLRIKENRKAYKNIWANPVEAATSLMNFKEEVAEETRTFLMEKKYGLEFERFDKMDPSSEEFKTEALRMSTEFLEEYEKRSQERSKELKRLMDIHQVSDNAVLAMEKLGIEKGSLEWRIIEDAAMSAMEEAALNDGTSADAYETMKDLAHEGMLDSRYNQILNKILEKVNDKKIQKEAKTPINTENTDKNNSKPAVTPEPQSAEERESPAPAKTETKKSDILELGKSSDQVMEDLYKTEEQFIKEQKQKALDTINKVKKRLEKKARKKLFGKQKYLRTLDFIVLKLNEEINSRDLEFHLNLYLDLTKEEETPTALGIESLIIKELEKEVENLIEKQQKDFKEESARKVKEINNQIPENSEIKANLLKNAALYKLFSLGILYPTGSGFLGYTKNAADFVDSCTIDSSTTTLDLIDRISAEINSMLIESEGVDETDENNNERTTEITKYLKIALETIQQTSDNFDKNAIRANEEALKQQQTLKTEPAPKNEGPADIPQTPLESTGGKHRENRIVSMPIHQELLTNPKGVFATFYTKYNIVQKLKDGILDKCKKDSRGRPMVFFITDGRNNELTRELQKGNYNEATDRPIIAAVEVSENSTSTIRVNGKNYQPIAIMPSSNADSSGSSHVGTIREAASKNKNTHVVRTNKGILTTYLFGTGIHSTMEYDVERKHSNTNVKEIVANDIEVGERNKLERLNQGRGEFLEGLRIVEREDTESPDPDANTQHLVFQVLKLNSDEVYNIDVFLQNLQESKDSEGMGIEERISSGKTVTDFNSQTQKAAKAFEDWVKEFPKDEIAFDEEGNPVGNILELLDKLAGYLGASVGKFLYISKKAGWHYSLELGNDGKSVAVILNNSNTKERNVLTSISLQDNVFVNSEEFLKNLILDNSNKVRTNYKGYSIVKWQISWNDVKSAAELEGAKEITDKQKGGIIKNFKDIYDAGLMEVDASTTTFQQNIEDVVLQSPFRSDESPAFNPPPKLVANDQNANQLPPIDSSPKPGVQKGDVVIDTQTDHADGKQPAAPTLNITERINRGLRKLQDVTSRFKLMEGTTKVDGEDTEVSWYEDKETGEKYPRMTSLMYADEEASKKGLKRHVKNNWDSVSLPIGNTIDAFLRDLFNVEKLMALNSENYSDTLSEIIEKILDNLDCSKYPNTTPEALREFARQMLNFKFSLERPRTINNGKGLTFISLHIVLPGTLAVKNPTEAGNKYTKVAGTIDMLAYDEEGNLYLFDFKTKHGVVRDSDLTKWSMQLSGYADILNEILRPEGLSVKGLYILPIDVSYPVPAGEKAGRQYGNTVYSTQKDALGLQKQLLYTLTEGINEDPKPFTGANPRFDSKRRVPGARKVEGMPGVVPVDKVTLKVDYNKMTATEQQFYNNTFNEEGTEVAPPSSEESGFVNVLGNTSVEQQALRPQSAFDIIDNQTEEGVPKPLPAVAEVLLQAPKYDATMNAESSMEIELGDFVKDGADFEIPPIEVDAEDTPVISKNNWKSMTDAERHEAIKMGYTKEFWDSASMDDKAREHIKGCIKASLLK